jgi:hypothetical protein
MSRTSSAGGLGRRVATAVAAAVAVTAALAAPLAAGAAWVEPPPGAGGALGAPLLWLVPPVAAAAWRALRRRDPAHDGRPDPAPRRGTWRDALSLARSSQDE